MSVFLAGIAYFASVFAVGFLLGSLRVLILEPALGPLAAVLIETPFILSASWLLCGYWVRRFAVAAATAPRLLMGFSAFGFLLLAEFILGEYGFGRSLSEQLSAYKETPGALGLAGQILFGLFPLFQARIVEK